MLQDPRANLRVCRYYNSYLRYEILDTPRDLHPALCYSYTCNIRVLYTSLSLLLCLLFLFPLIFFSSFNSLSLNLQRYKLFFKYSNLYHHLLHQRNIKELIDKIISTYFLCVFMADLPNIMHLYHILYRQFCSKDSPNRRASF